MPGVAAVPIASQIKLKKIFLGDTHTMIVFFGNQNRRFPFLSPDISFTVLRIIVVPPVISLTITRNILMFNGLSYLMRRIGVITRFIYSICLCMPEEECV
jgi:hypothetical protein